VTIGGTFRQRRTGMHREAPERINKEIIDFLAQ